MTVPHRFAAPAAIAAALLVAWTGSASAASIAFAPCAKRPGIECGTLVVPLDHSNPSGDSLPLHVERRRATRPLRGTLVLLAGGPGQAGTPIATDDPVAESVPGWNYVMLDQRGTGQGALRCSALDARSSTWSNAEVAHCADEVGPRRSFFGTRESVFDLEDLRNAMGVNTMALGGISYGTYVTQAYAQAYPTRVSHIVLDSVIDPAGFTGLDTGPFGSVRRVLTDLCAQRHCAGITTDPVGDIAALVAVSRTRPIRGNRTTGGGRVTGDVLGGPGSQDDLPYILIEGDLSTTLRALWPGAAHAARQGDPAPLMRLRTFVAARSWTPPTEISTALYYATMCADAALPWTSTTPVAERSGLAHAAATATGAAAFAPFGIDNVLADATVATCAPWPDAATDPLTAGPLPAVPTVLFAGGQDMRTPIESARAVAARSPSATLVVAPGGGHSLLYSYSCARSQMARLLNGGTPSTAACNREVPPIVPIAVPPATLAQVSPSGAPGTAGRVAHAARLTIRDGIRSMDAALDSGLSALPGIRGGLAHPLDPFSTRIRFLRFSAVRNVRITGTLRFNGTTFQGSIAVDGPGAYDGTLFLARGGERAYTGTIHGVPVRIPLG